MIMSSSPVKNIPPPKNIESSYLESYLLEIYASQFGELPPLNGFYGSHYLDDVVSYFKENDINLP